jgi:hypothetical protein
MKKSILMPACALMLLFTACGNKTNDDAPAGASDSAMQESNTSATGETGSIDRMSNTSEGSTPQGQDSTAVNESDAAGNGNNSNNR